MSVFTVYDNYYLCPDDTNYQAARSKLFKISYVRWDCVLFIHVVSVIFKIDIVNDLSNSQMTMFSCIQNFVGLWIL